jgi:BTB/POZ domain
MLATMVENELHDRVCSDKDEQGYLFVDRSFRLFDFVIEYLQTGRLTAAPQIGVTLNSVLCELEYYQLVSLQVVSNSAALMSGGRMPSLYQNDDSRYDVDAADEHDDHDNREHDEPSHVVDASGADVAAASSADAASSALSNDGDDVAHRQRPIKVRSSRSFDAFSSSSSLSSLPSLARDAPSSPPLLLQRPLLGVAVQESSHVDDFTWQPIESGALDDGKAEFVRVMMVVREQLANWASRAQSFFDRNAAAIARKIAQEVAGGGTMATVLSFTPATDSRFAQQPIHFSHTLIGTDFGSLHSLPPEIFVQHLVSIIRRETGFRTRASRYSGSRWITVHFPTSHGDDAHASPQNEAIDAFMDLVSTDSHGCHLSVSIH